MPIFRAAVGSTTGSPRISFKRIRPSRGTLAESPDSDHYPPPTRQGRAAGVCARSAPLLSTGAGAADLEIAQAFERLVPGDVDIAHECAGRPVLTPAHHLLDPCARTLEHRLDRARVEVAHPAAEPEPHRLVGGCVAEADALDTASKADVSASVRRGHRPRRASAQPARRRS